MFDVHGQPQLVREGVRRRALPGNRRLAAVSLQLSCREDRARIGQRTDSIAERPLAGSFGHHAGVTASRVLLDVGATADHDNDQSLVPQQPHRLAHGQRGQAELLVQVALGRQPGGDLPGGYPGAEDGRQGYSR
jgi:hypothetical protein